MPSSQQIQSEIAALEETLEPANAELDRLYAKFGNALPAEVESWMRARVRQRIEASAERVNAGGIEPLRQIKSDLNSLVQRLPEICSQAIGTPEQWPHRRSTTQSERINTASNESHPAATFRRAINHLGALLAKHGLLTGRPGHASEWEQFGNDQYRYSINPGFDERRFADLVEYQQKRHAQVRQQKLLEVKHQELAAARARELWDDA